MLQSQHKAQYMGHTGGKTQEGIRQEGTVDKRKCQGLSVYYTF